jgi:aspartate aminotransferase
MTPDRTVVSVGAKGVLYLALQVLLKEGDEVLVPAPAWLSYAKMVQAGGGRTVYVPTRPEDGYALDVQALRRAVTPRTRAIILNSPGNPTGAVFPDAVQAEVGRLAVEKGLVVLSDEIYEHLTYAPARFRSFAALAPEARDLTLVVNGVSKAYAMTGWRVGWGAGPKELIQRMVRLQSHANSGTPDFCQRAAHAALTGPFEPVARMQAAFARRRELMHAGLSRLEGLRLAKPEGAFYFLPDVSAFFGRRFQGKPVANATMLGELLIEHARAAVVPGDVFEAPYALRFSYACSEAHVENGVKRVVDFLRALS